MMIYRDCISRQVTIFPHLGAEGKERLYIAVDSIDENITRERNSDNLLKDEIM